MTEAELREIERRVSPGSVAMVDAPTTGLLCEDIRTLIAEVRRLRPTEIIMIDDPLGIDVTNVTWSGPGPHA